MGRHSDQPAPTESARPSFVRRHRGLLGSVLVLVVALVGAAAVFAFMLNSSLGNIERVPVTLEESNRPPVVQTESLNILLLGADAGSKRDPGGNSILEDAASGTWPKGKYRSDATMLVHIDADRKSAYIASIPRDSYVRLYDAKGAKKQKSKINAALSLYGPSGAISTVENLTDLRIDHLAMVDWDGFEDITNSLGGVDIITEEDGARRLNGKQALAYVGERYSLKDGDFGRVKRQQNLMRSLMVEMMDKGTLTNPLKLRSTVSSISKNMAVDEDWSNGSIRSLAFSMRGIRPADVTFMTIPTNGTGTDPVAGSIVNVDQGLSEQLFAAMADDTVGQFIEQYPELLLGAANKVD